VNDWLVILAALLFVAASWSVWALRWHIAERPGLGYAGGTVLCLFALGFMIITPVPFEIQRVIASTLFVGLGLNVMNVALSVEDRGKRLRARLSRLQGRLVLQSKANDLRFSELSQLDEARMPQLHKLLKSEKLTVRVDRAIERELETRDKIAKILARLDDLG